MSGRLRTVAYTPRTNLPTLEADLYDGSDVVTLVFLGRRSIVGIEPGRQLTAQGPDRDPRRPQGDLQPVLRAGGAAVTPGNEPRHAAAPPDGVEDRVAEEIVEEQNLHPVKPPERR